MRYLVLDTETTSLSPNTGQIIELAAIIINLDGITAALTIEAEFSCLIKPRYEIDEKITRLTGITMQQLLPAKNYLEVQDEWANWLEKNQAETLPIIGHSIDFDLGFLTQEGWMIPTGKVIDTLETCKLLLPTVPAINLEHLIHVFDLSKKFSATNIDGTKLQSHRALYDAKATAWLTQELLKIAQNLPLSAATIVYLQQIFLPDFKIFPTQLQLPNLEAIEIETEKIHVDVLSEIRGKTLTKTLVDGLKKSGIALIQSLENDLAFHSNNKEIAGILAKILVFISKINGSSFLKLHTYGSVENNILAAILHRCKQDVVVNLHAHLTADIAQNNTDADEKKLANSTLINPEQYISRIGFLAENSMDMGDLMNWLELANACQILDENGKTQLQKTLSQFDFFLFGMQSWWLYGQFFYTPHRFTPKHFSIQEKFANLVDELSIIEDIFLEIQPHKNWTNLQQNVLLETQNRLKKCSALQLSPNKNYTLRQRGDGLIISEQKHNFSLQTEFENVIKKHNITEIESYLSQANLEVLWKLTGLKLPPTITQTHTHDNPSMIKEELQNYDEIIAEIERTIKRENKHVVVFIGQHSTLKMLQSRVKTEVVNVPTLVIGEDGGITKLMSKLQASNPCLVIAKSADAGQLIAKLNPENTTEIWLINEPYLRLHAYWKEISEKTSDPETFTHSLRSLHTAAFCAKIYHKIGLKVHFVSNLH